MEPKHFYEVDLTWNEGKTGTLSSAILNKTIQCATPPEFTGGVPGIWSPEHLYAAAINSCFMATFLAIAANFKLPFHSFSCKVICTLEQQDGRLQVSEATLFPQVGLNSSADTEKAMRVLEKSKAACLITNSIKTDIALKPEITAKN